MGGEGVGGICSVAITWIPEEKESKKKKVRKEQMVSPTLCLEEEAKRVGAKINISEEETEGDSARCGAGDVDVGAEGS